MPTEDPQNIQDLEPNYKSQINARGKIVDILTKIETRMSYSDKLLDKELKEFDELDRRFITEIVNGVLRWQLRLDWYLHQLYLGSFDDLLVDVRNNLRSSVYQLLFLDKIPPYAVLFEAVEIAKAKYNQKTANLVNAILRNYLRQQKKFDFLEIELDILDKVSLKYSHPKWMLQRWIEYWGIDEVRLLCEANNARPRLAIRLNKSRADMDNFFKILDENGINYERHPDFEEFVWIDNFQEFRKLDFINKGWVSVQDVSTGIPVRVLDPQPGELILDMCAAPGGKTAYIAEKLLDRGGVLALDRHFSRIRMTKENVERLGFSNVFFTAADSVQLSTTKTFDRILLDAPCSGLGVLSKRSDLKWKRTEQDITNLKELQLNLLESAAQAVKLNGIIVYSTCTIEPEENEQVIETFLKRRPGFELEELGGYVPEKYLSNRRYVRTFPHKHKMDGSFVARLRKTSL